jgi:hypothetical protein
MELLEEDEEIEPPTRSPEITILMSQLLIPD